MNALLTALGSILLVWTLPPVVAAIAPGLEPDAAAAWAFALSLVWVIATGERVRCHRAGPAALASGFLAGLASYPGWCLGIAALGLALGLPPAIPIPATTPTGLASALVLSPAFEELLYRERLQHALRGVGTPCAARVVASAALFAVPHATPWGLLGAATVGLGLAATYERSGCVVHCIALHAGLNLGSLARIPPAAGVALAPAAVLLWIASTRLASRVAGGSHRALAPA